LPIRAPRRRSRHCRAGQPIWKWEFRAQGFFQADDIHGDGCSWVSHKPRSSLFTVHARGSSFLELSRRVLRTGLHNTWHGTLARLSTDQRGLQILSVSRHSHISPRRSRLYTRVRATTIRRTILRHTAPKTYCLHSQPYSCSTTLLSALIALRARWLRA